MLCRSFTTVGDKGVLDVITPLVRVSIGNAWVAAHAQLELDRRPPLLATNVGSVAGGIAGPYLRLELALPFFGARRRLHRRRAAPGQCHQGCAQEPVVVRHDLARLTHRMSHGGRARRRCDHASGSLERYQRTHRAAVVVHGAALSLARDALRDLWRLRASGRPSNPSGRCSSSTAQLG